MVDGIVSALGEVGAVIMARVAILRTAIILMLVYFTLNYLLNYIRTSMLRTAKKKRQISNIEIFTKIFRYMILFFLLITGIFSYFGSWTGLGLTMGLMSAALGWALQKPITGLAAWFMIVIKRPFEIGDRIIVGSVKGDVQDITLTHIYLNEIGGMVPSEENSGRTIMIPNAVMFEQNIINYTYQGEYVLDQVVTSVTYESNLDRAIAICLTAAKKHIAQFGDMKQEPYIRTAFASSSINVQVRYMAPATRLQEISSDITRDILDAVRKEQSISFAYPHTEVVFKDKDISVPCSRKG